MLERPSELVKLTISVVVLAIGLFLALYLFRGRVTGPSVRFEELLGDRPWRRLGAAISVVLAVMFVVGIYAVDIPERPVPYAVYWIIMLGLVVWLCCLAVKDVLHTRRTYRRWKTEIKSSAEGSMERRS